MEKTLEITITLTSKDEFTLDILEPESGDCVQLKGDDSYDGELVDRVGTEILSWVELMMDEQDDEEDDEEDEED